MNNPGGEGARLGLSDIDDGFLLPLARLLRVMAGWFALMPRRLSRPGMRDRARAIDAVGAGGLATWSLSRPPFVEVDAVQRAGLAARQAGAPLYVVHVSPAAALDSEMRARRASGSPVYLETCPHHLTHDVTWPGGVIGKINPPLLEASDREALWHALAHGGIDTIDRPCPPGPLGQAGRPLGRSARLPSDGDNATRLAK